MFSAAPTTSLSDRQPVAEDEHVCEEPDDDGDGVLPLPLAPFCYRDPSRLEPKPILGIIKSLINLLNL